MKMRMRVVKRRELLERRIDGMRGIRDGVGIDRGLREESHALVLALHNAIDISYKLLETSVYLNNIRIHHDHTNNKQQTTSNKLRVTTTQLHKIQIQVQVQRSTIVQPTKGYWLKTLIPPCPCPCPWAWPNP
jgi:hypothetical protein